MKRARIKAMVTVPARRKIAQDTPVNETIDITECDDKNKGTSENVSAVPQQAIESSFQENQVQENLIVERTEQESLRVNQDNERKDDSVRTPDEARKEIQSSESSNTAQISNFPPSPVKSTQNRLGFMRPTPKLDSGGRVRRNSIQGSGASASESEDDSRRATCTLANNTKNDSLQSSQNTKDTAVNNTKNNVIKSKVGQKRRMLVSESARKLAEARREFQLKHENKTPDRSKLTMYDLIYYNPVTNPMKKSKESRVVPKKVKEYQFDECQEEEETEDDPSSAMPVPQVKVGPNGQLIIDEQSLVIEQTNAKKNREVLAKEAIVDDENNGSGFYKKRQKSKDWPKWETLKFYKALNTVGTDFLLMQSLFPNRTRQEIKIKFKKEEKVNRNLVEKALAYHQEFDTDILEKSLATFENSAKENPTLFEKRKQQRSKHKSMTFQTRRRFRIVASSIGEMYASDNEGDSDCSDSMKKENTEGSDQSQQTLDKVDKRGCKRSREDESLTETNDVETLSVCTDVDSDTEIYRVRPTRSGRLPKMKKLQGPDINTLDSERTNTYSSSYETTEPLNDDTEVTENVTSDNANFSSENPDEDSIKTVIPSIGNVKPGSLVILSKESPEEPGKNVLQVYMVSSNINSENIEESNITPINLSPELLATVTTKLSDAESVAMKTECE